SIVTFVLVGVRLRELRERVVRVLAVPEVCRDGDTIAGAGMSTGEDFSARSSIVRKQLRADRLDVCRSFPVAQLTHVVVALVAVRSDAMQPPEQDVTARLHQP